MPDRTAVVRRILAAHLPAHADAVVTPLGHGEDHDAHAVGEDLVVRLRRPGREAGDGPEAEARLLRAVGAVSPLPVPAPVLALPAEGCLVLRRLPGTPLLHLPADARMRNAAPTGAALGRMLAALRALPEEAAAGLAPRDDTPPEAWRAEAADTLRTLAGEIPGDRRAALAAVVAAPAPAPPPRLVLTHNDLGIEHVLVDPGTWRVTGVVDWSDAAIADPARDAGLVLRDLGPAGLAALLAALPPPGEDPATLHDRILFLARCAALEDLAHGLSTPGAAAYAVAARDSLGRLFPA